MEMVQKYSRYAAAKFKVDRQLAKEMFVNEILLDTFFNMTTDLYVIPRILNNPSSLMLS
jgi:hypothetical protein